jgi:hypothetical protein
MYNATEKGATYNRAHVRQWRKENPEKLAKLSREYLRGFRRRHPEKARARDAVKYALRVGKLVKPETCSRCGQRKKLHAHHPDYSQRLIVIWVCQPCHKEIHEGGIIWPV